MSPPLTVGPPWRALVDHVSVGTVSALAEKLGVSRNTLYCWFNGRKPSKFTRAAVDAFATKRRLPPPFGGK